MNLLLQLFFEFFKAGLFSVGGGLATLPFLYDISARTGWYTTSDIANMIAISESTPGPIGINMSTYVGYMVAGVPGSLTASIGLITPSVIVILIVAAFLKAFKDNKYVQATFYGLRAASSGLIAVALWSVVKTTLFITTSALDPNSITFTPVWLNIVIAAIFLVVTNLKPLKKLHPAVFLLCGAIIGIILKLPY